MDHGTPPPWSEDEINDLVLLIHDLDRDSRVGHNYEPDTRRDDPYEDEIADRGACPVLNLGDRPGWLTEDEDLTDGFLLE
ncbi:hypothetical protein [Amycolatopsis suaedae]|uniref:Uncharacterized protein n=1 Tax=Amycolatopsis suaedae TaxID=2510978 RepID=A0A4Q7J344_9PSEU|nr:hypothetical protein [Amycolatopsis suaedae]RZQ61032.1 hypothetical protein EWH70_26590 [Amycolatopsis suaedae]